MINDERSFEGDVDSTHSVFDNATDLWDSLPNNLLRDHLYFIITMTWIAIQDRVFRVKAEHQILFPRPLATKRHRAWSLPKERQQSNSRSVKIGHEEWTTTITPRNSRGSTSQERTSKPEAVNIARNLEQEGWSRSWRVTRKHSIQELEGSWGG